MNKKEIKNKITQLETEMYSATFWNDKERAQFVIV